MTTLYTIFFIVAALWVLWIIGYPIYKKIKGERVFGIGSIYALGACIWALIINVLNLILQLMK